MNSNRRIAFSFSNGNRGSERSHSVHVGHASKYYININSCLGWVVGPAHLQAGCYLLCSVPYRRAQSFGHEPLRRQGSSTTSRPPQPLSAQAIKHIWVRTALFEKVLDKIVQHIVDNSRWFLCFKLFFFPWLALHWHNCFLLFCCCWKASSPLHDLWFWELTHGLLYSAFCQANTTVCWMSCPDYAMLWSESQTWSLWRCQTEQCDHIWIKKA